MGMQADVTTATYLWIAAWQIASKLICVQTEAPLSCSRLGIVSLLIPVNVQMYLCLRLRWLSEWRVVPTCRALFCKEFFISTGQKVLSHFSCYSQRSQTWIRGKASGSVQALPDPVCAAFC